MPFPALLVWGAAATVAAIGVKKGVDAYSDFDEAKSIGEAAEERYKSAENKLERDRTLTQKNLASLGELKATTFSRQIKHLVEIQKKFRSQLAGFDEKIFIQNLPDVEIQVERSNELLGGVASGLASGAMLTFGTYGAVGTLATASTGTAISALSGVAASNATLAWLGGGTIASGGFGIAGGMVALGGIAIAPLLAIGGFVAAGKAEKEKTNAKKYSCDVDVAVAEMDKVKVILKGIRSAAKQHAAIISETVKRFEDIKVYDMSDRTAFNHMFTLGKALKQILDVPVINADGTANKNIRVKCEGLIKLGNI